MDQMLTASRRRGGNLDVVPSAWTIDDVAGPNVSDKSTLLTMAYMALDAYVLNENDTQWEIPGKGLNRTEDIGWESDGIRGHVYGDETNSIIVIGIKGTTMGTSCLFPYLALLLRL